MTLAYNQPPSPTVLNQAAAWIGWGALLAVFAGVPGAAGALRTRGASALAAALALVCAGTVAACWVWELPASLALSIGATVTAALALARIGAGSASEARTALMRALCCGLVVAGVAGALIGSVQVFWPGLPDGTWLARTPYPGRAAGNLRQPNHLAGLLMWSAVAAAAWFEREPRLRAASAALFGLFVFAIVLTASRTGAVGVLLLAVWALADRRGLARPTRLLLLAAPIFFVICWWLLSTLAPAGDASYFGGSERLHASDVSSSRFKIWSNTFELLHRYPWGGVGIGEFNRAWTLELFSQARPVAFFDHTHNIVLQLLAELGLPAGTLVVALLLYALWRAARAPSLEQRCAFVMVAMTVLHSQLEYPLWYAHFLFPTALLLGLCLAGADLPRPRTATHWPTLAAGLALAAGGLLAVADYQRVVVIYAPSQDAGPLDERIEAGRASLLFAHHADYALVTTDSDSDVADFARATHYLLDARLMIAWARAYAEAGDLDRARWIAARLREFRNEQAADFYAECDGAPNPRPFQCDPPVGRYGPGDFR